MRQVHGRLSHEQILDPLHLGLLEQDLGQIIPFLVAKHHVAIPSPRTSPVVWIAMGKMWRLWTCNKPCWSATPRIFDCKVQKVWGFDLLLNIGFWWFLLPQEYGVRSLWGNIVWYHFQLAQHSWFIAPHIYLPGSSQIDQSWQVKWSYVYSCYFLPLP